MAMPKALKTAFNIAGLVLGGAGIVLGGALAYDGFLVPETGCLDVCIISKEVIGYTGLGIGGLSALMFWAGLRGVKNSAKQEAAPAPKPAP